METVILIQEALVEYIQAYNTSRRHSYLKHRNCIHPVEVSDNVY